MKQEKIEQMEAVLREYLPQATAQDLAAMAERIYTSLTETSEAADEYEAELAAKAKAAKAEEDALWNALLPAEQDRILAEQAEKRAANFAALMDYDPDSEEE